MRDVRNLPAAAAAAAWMLAMEKRASGAGQGIERVAAILRAVAERSADGARLVDIGAATGLSKSTVHRLINSLVSQGLIDHVEESNLYYLSLEMFLLGSAAANRHGLLEIARPHLEELAQRTGDAVILSTISRHDTLVIDRAEGDFPIQVTIPLIGEVRPLGLGAGSLTMMAALSDAEIDAAIQANREELLRYPNAGPSSIWSAIPAARQNGFVYKDGDYIPGMCALAVPVLAPDGRPLAAISITAIRDRMIGERLTQLLEMLQAEAKALASQLAPLYRVSTHWPPRRYASGKAANILKNFPPTSRPRKTAG